jgi:hydrogenase-1 operon protein HyaF
MNTPRPFPIPVVALGPGSQPDDEPLNVLPMPGDMSTFHAPALPEAEELASHGGALAALRATLAALRERAAGGAPAPIDLGGLDDADRALVNQVLGEGEVAAQVTGPAGVQAQESVFAGVWRVLQLDDGVVRHDTIEVGPVPAVLLRAAQVEAATTPSPAVVRPADTMNAPSILEELADRSRAWRPGIEPHVVNLTLLPLTPGDSLYLEGQLAAGSVLILSRGYGNCRIVNTRLPHTWRVTYFNSQDLIILDTLEVAAVPEVACAAPEDLADSAERLAEVLEWVAQA